MALRDLLVHLDDAESRQARIEAAVALAAIDRAHLLAVYLVADPSPKSHVRAGRAEGPWSAAELEAEARAGAVIDEFRTVAERAGIAFETRLGHVMHTEVADAIVEHARLVDLTVLGQVDPSLGGPHFLIGDVLMGSGRPVLVVPHAEPNSAIGRQVAIAWDGSREAARAVADSLAILARADAVRVLTVGRRSLAPEGTALAAYLARHGVATTVERIDADPGGAGDGILDHLRASACDLLVMGAYGHSRLRELILGGATRTMLRDSPRPLLLSH